jgi:hypothetical protein
MGTWGRHCFHQEGLCIAITKRANSRAGDPGEMSSRRRAKRAGFDEASADGGKARSTGRIDAALRSRNPVTTTLGHKPTADAAFRENVRNLRVARRKAAVSGGKGVTGGATAAL